MVLSEEEKKLRKQVRKEEKRIQKFLNKVEEDDPEDPVFDPIDLRTKRQMALANAMNQPIFKESSRASSSAATTEQYPYVFDSHAKTKGAAGE